MQLISIFMEFEDFRPCPFSAKSKRLRIVLWIDRAQLSPLFSPDMTGIYLSYIQGSHLFLEGIVTRNSSLRTKRFRGFSGAKKYLFLFLDPVPGSFFSPQPHRNACYTGYRNRNALSQSFFRSEIASLCNPKLARKQRQCSGTLPPGSRSVWPGWSREKAVPLSRSFLSPRPGPLTLIICYFTATGWSKMKIPHREKPKGNHSNIDFYLPNQIWKQ